jgi:hypothetical protein
MQHLDLQQSSLANKAAKLDGTKYGINIQLGVQHIMLRCKTVPD